MFSCSCVRYYGWQVLRIMLKMNTLTWRTGEWFCLSTMIFCADSLWGSCTSVLCWIKYFPLDHLLSFQCRVASVPRYYLFHLVSFTLFPLLVFWWKSDISNYPENFICHFLIVATSFHWSATSCVLFFFLTT